MRKRIQKLYENSINLKNQVKNLIKINDSKLNSNYFPGIKQIVILLPELETNFVREISFPGLTSDLIQFIHVMPIFSLNLEEGFLGQEDELGNSNESALQMNFPVFNMTTYWKQVENGYILGMAFNMSMTNERPNQPGFNDGIPIYIKINLITLNERIWHVVQHNKK